jgi:hypothetical protein
LFIKELLNHGCRDIVAFITTEQHKAAPNHAEVPQNMAIFIGPIIFEKPGGRDFEVRLIVIPGSLEASAISAITGCGSRLTSSTPSARSMA